ncbi:MAG: ATP synthase F1 subunit delta [Candidatus Komeilibacteria bacterium]|nr:ATP synthase F1 subunit delta [Candidatus Komeilibacteria bacterium]
MKKITPKQYASALYEAVKDKSGAELKSSFNNFLALVWQHKDWKNLAKILTSFGHIYNQQEGITEAVAVSAQKLSPAIFHKLEHWLAEQTQKKVILKTEVDQSLLGGVVIKYDDLILDGSLKTQLANLKNQLNS